MRHRLPRLCIPAVSPQRLDCSWHARSRVPYHREQRGPCEERTIRLPRSFPWPNTQHTVVTRPLTQTLPTTRSRTSVGHWSARKAGATRGEIAPMHTLPPGLRNDPKNPRATRRTPQNTSNGPSCPCASRCATTAPAVVPPLSCRHSPSKVSNPCPHDAPCTALYAAITRR
jgi:hypothetical protein